MKLTSSYLSPTSVIFSSQSNYSQVLIVFLCFNFVSVALTRDIGDVIRKLDKAKHHVRHLRHQLERNLEKEDTGYKHTTSPHIQQYDEKLEDVEVGGPQCPPSVRPVTNSLCNVRKCFSHAECQPATSDSAQGVAHSPEMERVLQRRACCYNGCVYSCMHRMPPPAVFDWIEETPDYVSSAGNSSMEETGPGLYPWLSRRYGDDDYTTATDDGEFHDEDYSTSAHIAPPDVVALSGGCVLTHSQYLEYQIMKTPSKYVEVCYCKQGEVYCKVPSSSAGTSEH